MAAPKIDTLRKNNFLQNRRSRLYQSRITNFIPPVIPPRSNVDQRAFWNVAIYYAPALHRTSYVQRHFIYLTRGAAVAAKPRREPARADCRRSTWLQG